MLITISCISIWVELFFYMRCLVIQYLTVTTPIGNLNFESQKSKIGPILWNTSIDTFLRLHLPTNDFKWLVGSHSVCTLWSWWWSWSWQEGRWRSWGWKWKSRNWTRSHLLVTLMLPTTSLPDSSPSKPEIQKQFDATPTHPHKFAWTVSWEVLKMSLVVIYYKALPSSNVVNSLKI